MPYEEYLFTSANRGNSAVGNRSFSPDGSGSNRSYVGYLQLRQKAPGGACDVSGRAVWADDDGSHCKWYHASLFEHGTPACSHTVYGN